MQKLSDMLRGMLHQYSSLPTLVHFLCFGCFVNRVGSFVMLFLTIYISDVLKLGTSFASFCVGAFGVGSIASAILGGHLADQFGRRITMLIALFGGAALLCSLAFISNGWMLMAMLFLFALIMEMYRPACSAMIGDLVSNERRPHAYSLLYLSFNLGFAIAPPIGGWLAKHSFLWLFLIDGITTALFGVVVLMFIRETLPRRVQSAADEEARHSGDSPVAAAEALASSESSELQNTSPNMPRISLQHAIRHIAGDHKFLLFCFCSLLTNIVFMQAFVTLPMYLHRMGFDEHRFGSMICVNGILIVLCQLPATHVLSKLPRMYVMIAGEILLALGFGLTVFAGTPITIIGTIVLWTFGEILQAPYKPALVAELAPTELRARYMGLFNTSHAASIAIGAPLGGFVLSRFGPEVLWPGCGLVLLLTAQLYVILFRQIARAHQPSPVSPAAQTT